jgi:transcriptional regulator with XRE-family HTH domain
MEGISLKEARVKKGLLPTEAARLLGITTYSLYLREQTGMRKELFLKHCQVLGIDPSTISTEFIKPERTPKSQPVAPDESWDARKVKKQSAQCRSCAYRQMPSGKGESNAKTFLCGHLLITGKLRKNEGAGNCKSYKREAKGWNR